MIDQFAGIRVRFNKYVEPDPDSDCLIWTGAVARGGRGCFTFTTKNSMPAIRAAWLLAGRELPPHPMVFDHLCKNHRCVNVDHLEAVSPSENVRRGSTVGRTNMCGKGLHEWIPENIMQNGSKKMCRPCRNMRQLERYHRLKQN
jgi:hypothetical protein